MVCGSKKTPIAKKSPFYKEKLKNDGLIKFLGHVSATLDDPPGHRGT
jgi:hypothetical protein